MAITSIHCVQLLDDLRFADLNAFSYEEQLSFYRKTSSALCDNDYEAKSIEQMQKLKSNGSALPEAKAYLDVIYAIEHELSVAEPLVTYGYAIGLSSLDLVF